MARLLCACACVFVPCCWHHASMACQLLVLVDILRIALVLALLHPPCIPCLAPVTCTTAHPPPQQVAAAAAAAADGQEEEVEHQQLEAMRLCLAHSEGLAHLLEQLLHQVDVHKECREWGC